MKINIPTFLTLIRIILVPFMVIIFYLPIEYAKLLTVIIFFIASVTDWLDGYLARKWNQTSALGAFLDPVADKIIVAVTLIIIVSDYNSWIYAIPATIIIGREITISALREWMAEIGESTLVAVSSIGKVKTATQMLSIAFLLYRDDIVNFPTSIVGLVLLYIAAILTLWSMVIYIKAAWLVIKKQE